MENTYSRIEEYNDLVSHINTIRAQEGCTVQELLLADIAKSLAIIAESRVHGMYEIIDALNKPAKESILKEKE